MRRRRKALLGLLVAALVLLLTEAALRLLWGPPPPPVRVHSGLGPVSAWFAGDDAGWAPTYQRSPAQAPFPARHPGPRFAVLGGSSVHGGSHRVGPESEFPGLLADALGLPVLNLGAPALDSFDHVQIAATLAPWDWTAVVLYAGHNDYGNAFFHARYAGAGGALEARLRAGLEHSQLFVQLRRAIGDREGRPSPALDPVGGHLPAFDPARQATATRHFEANLRRIAWNLDRHGVPLVLVTPSSDLLGPPLGQDCPAEPCAARVFERGRALLEADPAAAAALLAQARDLDPMPLRAPGLAAEAMRRVAADTAGVHLVDAARDLPRDRAAPVPDRRLFQDPVHLSLYGHQAMAALIAPTLRRLAAAAPVDAAPGGG
jgi:hypothetical protein